jgi:hypothetical protein
MQDDGLPISFGVIIGAIILGLFVVAGFILMAILIGSFLLSAAG